VLNNYDVMKFEDICKLPVDTIAADDCFLFMWGTWPLLPEALHLIKVHGVLNIKPLGLSG
jgi:N6-adenosine-specific RNA methylase IME4